MVKKISPASLWSLELSENVPGSGEIHKNSAPASSARDKRAVVRLINIG